MSGMAPLHTHDDSGTIMWSHQLIEVTL
jgi:hypothetical protein